MCDFGFARVFDPDENSQHGIMTPNLGTIGSMAPEMRQKDYGFEVDIYSFGMLGFLVYTKQEPLRCLRTPFPI